MRYLSSFFIVYNWTLPSNALLSVTSSVYSKSPPTGIPCAILVTFIPSGFINFDKYKTCYLYIDNDNAGNDIAAKLLELYPFMKRVNMTCGCKDFNEHYLKCIKNII